MTASPKPEPEEPYDDEKITRDVRIAADIFFSQFARRVNEKAREDARWELKSGGPKGPGGLPPGLELEKMKHNERTKLSANLLNALSGAFCVGSGITTFTNISEFATNWQKILSALLWLAFGAIFHLLARRYLGRLR